MKGVDVLLRAFVSETPASDVSTEAHLRIVGDGSERRALQSLAQTLGIADRVTFVGFVAPPAVYDEFAAAEIFCGLSRSEALGNVFLEAQAAGCAVIGTKVGGIPDIIKSGVNGWLIEPDNAEEAAEALKRLLTETELRLELADTGRKHAANYDWNDIAKRYAQIYEQLL
mgnify:CR=1 FL=1